MEFIVLLWNEVIIRPMLNTLMVLYVLSFNNMGIAIIIFTILVRVVTLPLTLKQLHQMRAMSGIQPKMKELQERYKGDRTRISQETMRMYRESGVNPVGCLGPLVVQMPILIGLFRVLVQTLYTSPDDLAGLSTKLYSWITFVPIHAAAPLNNVFLGLDLGANPTFPQHFIIPLAVAASTWVQSKMTMTPTADARQQSSQNMMLWMMPVMLGFFSFSFPIGLSMYWTISNVIGVAIQYFITGWGPLFPLFPKSGPAAATAQSPETGEELAPKEIETDGNSRKDRPHRRRSRRTGAERARRRPQRGRGRSTK